jgi:hypothetical protein
MPLTHNDRPPATLLVRNLSRLPGTRLPAWSAKLILVDYAQQPPYVPLGRIVYDDVVLYGATRAQIMASVKGLLLVPVTVMLPDLAWEERREEGAHVD